MYFYGSDTVRSFLIARGASVKPKSSAFFRDALQDLDPRQASTTRPSHCPSFGILNEGRDSSRGPVSEDFGFMADPQDVMSAKLPQALLDAAAKIPSLHASEGLKEYMQTLDLAPCTRGLQGMELLMAKSIVYTLAQAYMDSIRGNDKEITTDSAKSKEPVAESKIYFPRAFENTIEDLSRRSESMPYCTLSDICLYNITFTDDAVARLQAREQRGAVNEPNGLTHQDMHLQAPVLTGLRPHESEQERLVRETVESRFFLTTVEMGYATSDMPYLVAKAQQAMYDILTLRPQEDSIHAHSLVQSVVESLVLLKQSAVRMKEAFAKLNMKDVSAKVFHKEVAKLTLGYNGNAGPSGPQHPSVHLLDVFIGRQAYSSEMGQVILKARKHLPANHREFVAAVERGPSIETFLAHVDALNLPVEDVVTAINDLIDEYTKSGFLAAHRKKAYAYLRAGFSNGARESTGGASCQSQKDLPKQMLGAFADSLKERSVLVSSRKGTKRKRNMSSSRS